MSIYHRMKWLELVQDTLPKDKAAQVVALRLQRHYDDKTRKLIPSYETMAKELTWDESTVMRAMTRLRRAKLLRWVPGHYGKANFYTLTHSGTGAPISSAFASTSGGQKRAVSLGENAHPTPKENSWGAATQQAAPPPELKKKTQPAEEETRIYDDDSHVPFGSPEWKRMHPHFVPYKIRTDEEQREYYEARKREWREEKALEEKRQQREEISNRRGKLIVSVLDELKGSDDGTLKVALKAALKKFDEENNFSIYDQTHVLKAGADGE